MGTFVDSGCRVAEIELELKEVERDLAKASVAALDNHSSQQWFHPKKGHELTFCSETLSMALHPSELSAFGLRVSYIPEPEYLEDCCCSPDHHSWQDDGTSY